MKRIHEPAAFANPDYQQQIAINLVYSLGRDDAVDMCIENGWDHTLRVILKDERYFAKPGDTTVN